ncbi:hypothetical protein HDU79_007180 [Rhizoclosmatium sp. JEL0117]|nr:hypothetical protein HDU79_007180 [Rhizoclosmatium sp. JEL0117]
MAAETQILTFGAHTFRQGTLPELMSAFEEHLVGVDGCTPISPDLPEDSPSRGLAALWLRAAFHDIGKYDPATGQPVAGLLGSFLNQTENAGIGQSIAMRFAPKAKFPYSNADYIALAAQVTVTHCGGPAFDFLKGRVDAPPTSFKSIPADLPDDLLDSYQVIKQKLRRLGFSNEDMVALVSGSHSLGGVHAAISPHATKQTFEAFDRTPGVFDNDIFKQSLNGNCRLNIDCNMANDPELRPIYELYANDEAAFFRQYQESFQKMTTVGQNRAALVAFHLDISVHANLFAEGTVAGGAVPTPGQILSGSLTKATATLTSADVVEPTQWTLTKSAQTGATNVVATAATKARTESTKSNAMVLRFSTIIFILLVLLL